MLESYFELVDLCHQMTVHLHLLFGNVLSHLQVPPHVIVRLVNQSLLEFCDELSFLSYQLGLFLHAL